MCPFWECFQEDYIVTSKQITWENIWFRKAENSKDLFESSNNVTLWRVPCRCVHWTHCYNRCIWSHSVPAACCSLGQTSPLDSLPVWFWEVFWIFDVYHSSYRSSSFCFKNVETKGPKLYCCPNWHGDQPHTCLMSTCLCRWTDLVISNL